MIEIIHGDCLEVMLGMDTDSVDLVCTSPPYGNQRRYDSKLRLFENDDHWLQWTADRFMQCLRVSRGLVAFVVEGYTKGGAFHPLPEMLTVEVMRRGGNVRRRAIYHRFGTPGGSPDELAQHHEIVVMASAKSGRLPYADPKATGHPPVCKPGGNPTHRKASGERVNKAKRQARGGSEKKVVKAYKPPSICKASNVISCGAVGGGNMGSPLACENEAPYCEKLIEPVVLTWCPPGGLVLDPFCGSATTGAVAKRFGRGFIGIDDRKSQVELSNRRMA